MRAFAEITVEHSFGGGDGGGGGAEGCVHAKQPSHADQPHFLSQPFVLVAQEALHLPGAGAGGGGVAVHSEQPPQSDQPHFLSQPFVLVAHEGLQLPIASEAQAPHPAHFDQAHLTVQSLPSSRQNLRQSSPAAEASATASTQYLISGERQVRAECAGLVRVLSGRISCHPWWQKTQARQPARGVVCYRLQYRLVVAD